MHCTNPMLNLARGSFPAQFSLLEKPSLCRTGLSSFQSSVPLRPHNSGLLPAPHFTSALLSQFSRPHSTCQASHSHPFSPTPQPDLPILKAPNHTCNTDLGCLWLRPSLSVPYRKGTVLLPMEQRLCLSAATTPQVQPWIQYTFNGH